MGLRGPPPKPTAVRIREGNRGHATFNPNEPSYTAGIPERPILSAGARKLWDSLVGELASSGVLRLVDAGALAQLCEDSAMLETLRKGLATQVREIEKAAKEKKKPLPGGALIALARTNEGRRVLAAMREIAGQIIVQRREFGLTPASSTRINAAGGPGGLAGDPLERALCGLGLDGLDASVQ